MEVCSCHLLFDYFQFALIHGPNIPGSYAILLFAPLDFTSIISDIYKWVLFLLLLCFFILSGVISPVAYWAPTDLESSSFSVLSFAFSYCSWGSRGKNTEVVSLSLLRWTTFCQNSPLRPIHLGWPYMAWLIVALS